MWLCIVSLCDCDHMDLALSYLYRLGQYQLQGLFVFMLDLGDQRRSDRFGRLPFYWVYERSGGSAELASGEDGDGSGEEEVGVGFGGERCREGIEGEV